MKETVSRCPTAGIAVRYTNCTIITNFTSLVSGRIGELGRDEKLLRWSRARNRNKEEFRFSTEQTGERGDRSTRLYSAVNLSSTVNTGRTLFQPARMFDHLFHKQSNKRK